MKLKRFANKFTPRVDSGQAVLITVLALGIFLLGAMAFAIDLSNLWFRRQAAQTAADAACTAGAMDLLVDATNGGTTQGNFDTANDPNPFICGTSKSDTKLTPSPCQYASLNGFNSSISSGSAALGNNVTFNWSPVTTAPADIVAPPAGVAPTPFMQVIVTDNSPSFFLGLLKGAKTQSVRGIAVCGVAQSAAPIPILILDPVNPPKGNAFSVQGTPVVDIFGGPSRSIQVNSSDTAAVNAGGNGLIDLSNGGPSGTGSDLGVFGGPTTAPGAPGTKNFNPGTTGHWLAPASPIGDPFAQTCYPGQPTTTCSATINGNSAPAVPVAPGVPADLNALNSQNSSKKACTSSDIQSGNCSVTYQTHGCPDSASTITNLTCTIYTAGAYPGGIAVKNGTSIFDPGLYYVTGGLALQANSTVRPGTGLGDGSGGVTFYFSGTGTVSVDANSGKSTSLDPFNTLKGPGVVNGNTVTPYASNVTYTAGVQCTAKSAVPANLQGTGSPLSGLNVNGNILLGPCTGYYGDPLGTNEPDTSSNPPGPGEQRWFLFFQDRSATGVSPGWGGGGQFLLAGTMYFHSCNSSGTGVSCTPPPTKITSSSFYQDNFSLSGNSSNGTYVLGEIVTDNLTLGGTSGINMDLNPTTAFNVLKASLYQ